MSTPVRFGARWVTDGPSGRFHTRTRAEALAVLALLAMIEGWRWL